MLHRVVLVLCMWVAVAHGYAMCPGNHWLCYPAAPELNRRAPSNFRVDFYTTKGRFTIDVTRAWAPFGADRFYNLVRAGYYNQNRFYRVLPNWVCQWGVNGDPSVSQLWEDQYLPDDPVLASNTQGAVAFSAMYDATKSWSTNRTTELYINYHNNSQLDAKGFAVFGVVSHGFGVVQQFYSGYGEMCERPGPPQCYGHIAETTLYAEGNSYLNSDFPLLEYATLATVVDDPRGPMPLFPRSHRDFWHKRLGFFPSLLIAGAVLCAAGVLACVVVALRQRFRRKTGGWFSQLNGRSAGRGFVPPTSEVELGAVATGQAVVGSSTFAGAVPPSDNGQGWGAAQAVTSASSGGDDDET